MTQIRESFQLVVVTLSFLLCWLCPIQGTGLNAEYCEEFRGIGSSLLQEGVARRGKLSLVDPESSIAKVSAESQHLTNENVTTNASHSEKKSITIEASQNKTGLAAEITSPSAPKVSSETVGVRRGNMSNASLGKDSLIKPESSSANASVNSQHPTGKNVTANASHPENKSISPETSRNKTAESTSPLARSFLNEIVGDDGVLVLSLARQPHRFAYTKYQMSLAGIQSTLFPAADPLRASEKELNQGCISQKPNNAPFNATCYGCAAKREQAIALSHRRALEKAANRSSKWTALLEDDMALVRPERWDSAFRRAWEKIPPKVKFVRLSWCMIVADRDDIVQKDIDTDGDFFLTQWMSVTAANATYSPGLCTGGYLVHQDVIPELLGLFPCCAPVDGQYRMLQESIRANGKPWGMDVMVSIEARGSREYVEATTRDTWLGQHGVMYQNRPAVVELKEKLAINSLEKVLTPTHTAA